MILSALSVLTLFRAPLRRMPRMPFIGLVLGGLAGRGRLKAPHIALPGYHNDSQ